MRRLLLIFAAGIIFTLLLLRGDIIISAKRALQYAFSDTQEREIAMLKDENIALRTECMLRESEGRFSETGILRAHAFSTYPYNTKNQITIAAGESSGISIDDLIMQNGVFIGQIISTDDTFSVARTVFDPIWEFPVRIGEEYTDALFRGGARPRLTLIPRGAPIVSDALIITSFTGIPYGMPVGTVGDIDESFSEPFFEANIVFPYNINRILRVDILLR